MLKGKITSGNLILSVSLSLSAILACCVASSCNALQHDRYNPVQQFSTREKLFVSIGEHGQRAFSFGEGKTHEERIRSLVEHSLLSVLQDTTSSEWGQLQSQQGLVYTIYREDVPGAVKMVAKVAPDGALRIEGE